MPWPVLVWLAQQFFRANGVWPDTTEGEGTRGEGETAAAGAAGSSSGQPPQAAQTQAQPQEARSGGGGNSASGPYYKMPFPQMITYATVAPSSSFFSLGPGKGVGIGRGHPLPLAKDRYDYAGSVYYTEANKLVAEAHTSASASSGGIKLPPEAIATLAFIIAWCCFPLFRGMREREGQWMTLSRDRAARELGISPTNFNLHIKRLEEAGLIQRGNMAGVGAEAQINPGRPKLEPGGIGNDQSQSEGAGARAGEIISAEEFFFLRYDATRLAPQLGGGRGGFWGARTVQKNNYIYRLLVDVDHSSLPAFNPFSSSSSSSETDVVGAIEIVSEYQTDLDSQFKSTGTDVRRTRTGIIGLEPTQTGRNGLNLTEDGLVSADQARLTSVPAVPPCINYESINNDDDGGRIILGFEKRERTDKEEENKKGQGKLAEAEKVEEPQQQPQQLPPSSPLSPADPMQHGQSQGAGQAEPQSQTVSALLPGQLAVIVSKLSTAEKAKFDFLNNEAYFVGFARQSDGRNTLDSSQALRFAQSQELDLARIKELHQQVREMWERGECSRTPLGALHAALKRNCDPRSMDDEELARLKTDQARRRAKWERDENIPPAVTAKDKDKARAGADASSPPPPSPSSVSRSSSSSFSDRNSPRARRQREDEQKQASWRDTVGKMQANRLAAAEEQAQEDEARAVMAQEEEGELMAAASLYGLANTALPIPVVDPAIALSKLAEALRDRYRRPELAAKLLGEPGRGVVGAELSLDHEAHKVAISFTHAPWLANSFLAEDRALIKIVVSQELGQGYELQIG